MKKLFKTVDDLMKENDEYERKIRKNPVWGNWTITKNRTLEYYKKGYQWYEVDLERCKTSAEVLDWIFQIFHKDWADSQIFYNLCHALDDIFSIQATFCSFGKEQNPSKNELYEKIDRFEP